MRTKRVLAVLQGTWGDVKPEEAKRTLCAFMESLQSHGREHDTKIAVEYAETLDGAKEMLDKGHMYDLVVFNSRGVLEEARKLKASHRRTQMVLLTGLLPDDELVIMHKGWLGGNLDPLFHLL